MKISGHLEDAGAAEVMQLIHFGGRSGTLYLESEGKRAEVGFNRGRLARASVSGSPRLGELLVKRGLIDQGALRRALAQQTDGGQQCSIGQILIASGLVSDEDLRREVEKQIEQAVTEIVGWDRGTFNFAIEELNPVGEIARYPGEVTPDLHLNTQKLLLEATCLLDERKRSAAEREGDDGESEEQAIPAGETPTSGSPGDGVDPWQIDELSGAGDGAARVFGAGMPAAHKTRLPRLQIVSPDEELAARLRGALAGTLPQIVRVDLRDAGAALPGEPPPAVIVDLRRGLDVSSLEALRRMHPHVLLIAVSDRPEVTAAAYRAGAMAVVHRDPEAVAECVRRLFQEVLVRRPSEDNEGENGKAALGRLRRVLGDIRSGLFSATVSLNLMSIVSESAERGVLFLVQRNSLKALGAFGFTNGDNRPLAEVTRGLSLPIEPGYAYTEAIKEGRLQVVSFEEESFPRQFVEVLGPPRVRHCVLIPVLGRERVICVVYADNGPVNRDLCDMEIIEVATAQVGFAFENELLRQQIEQEQLVRPSLN